MHFIFKTSSVTSDFFFFFFFLRFLRFFLPPVKVLKESTWEVLGANVLKKFGECDHSEILISSSSSYITMGTDPRPVGERGAYAFIWETLIRREALI